MHSDDLLKVHQLDLTASMQPQHATSDRFIAEQHWGSRSRYAYLFKPWSQAEPGSFSGQMPRWKHPIPSSGCMPPSPAAVQATVPPLRLVSRREDLNRSGVGCLFDHPCSCCGQIKTIWQPSGWEKADLIVLDQDPFNIPPSELYALSPSAVMVDGNWVVNHL